MALRLVYIDDEPDMCQMFVDLFESPTVQVFTFTDVSNIVEDVRRINPHLALIDYRLRNTNGDAVARSLDPELPKALISGELVIEPEVNFVRIFEKPFDFDQMEAFIAGFAATLGTRTSA